MQYAYIHVGIGGGAGGVVLQLNIDINIDVNVTAFFEKLPRMNMKVNTLGKYLFFFVKFIAL